MCSMFTNAETFWELPFLMSGLVLYTLLILLQVVEGGSFHGDFTK